MAWDIVLEDKSAEKGGNWYSGQSAEHKGAAIMSFSHYNPMIIQMWYLQKSASDSARILSKMALKDTELWWLRAF